MPNTNKRQSHEATRVVNAIRDDKVRYFYLMLGEAIGEHMNRDNGTNRNINANTSSNHLAELITRLNAG